MHNLIFETRNLLVRKLIMNDIDPYHEMQSNPKVMQYVVGKVQSKQAHLKEIAHLIELYQKESNDFWIYAVERKSDNKFVGTLALIKDEYGEDEIGYRFLEKYWGMGYGFELCKGSIDYCGSQGITKLIGYVIQKNMASVKILQKCNFQTIQDGVDAETQLPETKYELIL